MNHDAIMFSAGEPSLHQLRLFVVLTEELHFGRAAQRTFLTQPAFSKQIKQLEKRLGTRLVERHTRSAELTPAGEALIPAAHSVLDAMNGLRELADEHSRQQGGRLVLGSIGGEAAQPYTHAMLAELRRAHPEIRVEIRNLGFGSQFGTVASGKVDAAVLRPPVPAGLRTQHLATEPRVVALPSSDPLIADGADAVALSDLRDRTFIDMPTEVNREWWDYWQVNPRPDGTPVRFGPVVDDVEALWIAIGRGDGIAFLPEGARRLYPRPDITFVDVVDLPPAPAALVWAAKNHSLPGVTALRSAAREVADRRSDPR
jgi:DNA-binding transcriptional LysR family regulator